MVDAAFQRVGNNNNIKLHTSGQDVQYSRLRRQGSHMPFKATLLPILHSFEIVTPLDRYRSKPSFDSSPQRDMTNPATQTTML